MGRRIRVIISLIIFTVSLFLLYNLEQDYQLNDIILEIKQFAPSKILLAVLLTLVSYLLLTLYDYLAIRELKSPLSYQQVAPVSFLAFTFSNTIGFSLLTGTSIRYKFYSELGLSGNNITQVVLACSVTFFLGLFFICGLALINFPAEQLSDLPLPTWFFSLNRVIGILMLLGVISYFVFSLIWKRSIHFRGFELAPPIFSLSLKQFLVSSIDWIVVGTLFYSLLPEVDGLSYLQVLSIFFVANAIGVLAHVPGGIGVFETVVTVTLSQYLPAEQILSSVIIYRLMYYIVPFVLALMYFVATLVLTNKDKFSKLNVNLQIVRQLLPPLLSISVFGVGLVLLLSVVNPSIIHKYHWLGEIVPLPIVELSSLILSASAILLLLLSHGLFKRYQKAFELTQKLLLVAMVFIVLKGAQWQISLALGLIYLLMLPCEQVFYRQGSIVGIKYSFGWALSLAAALFLMMWVLFFAYQDVDYDHSLWFTFSQDSHVSRALRGGAVALVILLIFAFRYVLAMRRPQTRLLDEHTLSCAMDIVANAPSSHGFLALVQDKSLLFNEDNDAFLMYARAGHCWIVMGDPIGNPDKFDDLLWQFRELCDAYDGWPVFYQVTQKYLPHFLEQGLSLYKLGEEAIVPLAEFDLQSSKYRSLRQSHAKALREGLRFKIIEASEVKALLPTLEVISSSWLKAKQGREKGFSVGYFSAAYLCATPMALVYLNDELVAFSNVWASAAKIEFSVDLMRYQPSLSGSNIMDFLFTELLQWGKQQGYQLFNLGMAPMSGLTDRALVPFWTKLAKTVYKKGNKFYNFQGLRRYKDKFNPRWEAKYLICYGGLSLPVVVGSLVTLTSRGTTGVFKK
ncbi:bifunctional lysylphosphatidylglycerol flippase/synthetase MprF [Shewanella xiamenensis]|uniref:bifunctional lysylphosphatidylglycerol flippase/synthetase MprF n=1 Tax=Shewanella xiamenensis TaxID=332186 RepID=UPI0024A6C4D1|nr:bifunctional lysylphosphatidylglycerol flippase/synthetase MprF [Shewanella xiamenensis]MDI5835057.1 bifunctional lysylphosphatidylglycerol flippase/synthetase MprF [Shewanella xiamenensis]MDI5839170.1 bifunctional lysylphosphatidylglycerol flippase/synthetase MprF [Shewanella xiamenensis]MDI5843275.1 bifunctional lysylphosphatidylglycerol flippase/synthetase MprF [Shewanella xiamenensis]MDI5851362.1 bifunctional lysylphosphatidylglycerol flippase/synthetase MprF [Shewanella xiamenensis]MDI